MKKKVLEIDIELMKSLLVYWEVEGTSNLFWKVGRSGTNGIGSMAGHLREDGYYTVKVDGKGYNVHRIIYTLHFGNIPSGRVIDHRYGDPSDNRISGLRCITHRQNMQNQIKAKGVYAKGKRWHATIGVNGRGYPIGMFPTRPEAIEAHRRAKSMLHKLDNSEPDWNNFYKLVVSYRRYINQRYCYHKHTQKFSIRFKIGDRVEYFGYLKMEQQAIQRARMVRKALKAGCSLQSIREAIKREK